MDGDVVIKLIYAGSLTVIYGIIFVRVPMDIAIITSLVSGFVGALSAVISYNLGQRSAYKKIEKQR